MGTDHPAVPPVNPTDVEVVALVAAVAAYGSGVLRGWARWGPQRVVRRWQAMSFLAGIGVITLATVGPGDQLADRGVAGHMVQHVLLMLVGAPLLAVGRPLEAVRSAVPLRHQRRSRRPMRALARWSSGQAWAVMAALIVSLHTAVMVGWHVPALYDLAVRNEWVHGLEHVTLVTAAVALWWVVLGGVRRGPAPAAILALFAANLPMTVLGFAMVFSTSVWYRSYQTGLEDQQAAGVVLWGAGGALMVVEAAVTFGLWLGQPERELTRRERPGSSSVDGAPVGMRPR